MLCRGAGVLTTDPRIVPGAQPVPLLTFDEATELAYFGATVLHPLAMQPALQSNQLAVRVKNSYNRCAIHQALDGNASLMCVCVCVFGFANLSMFVMQANICA
jgi:aspartate kinase